MCRHTRTRRHSSKTFARSTVCRPALSLKSDCTPGLYSSTSQKGTLPMPDLHLEAQNSIFLSASGLKMRVVSMYVLCERIVNHNVLRIEIWWISSCPLPFTLIGRESTMDGDVAITRGRTADGRRGKATNCFTTRAVSRSDDDHTAPFALIHPTRPSADPYAHTAGMATLQRYPTISSLCGRERKES